MLRTETRPKIRVIESFIIFRIYFAEVSGWGREFVVCKCCKDEIKICVISLLCVKINLLTKTFIIPLNERYVFTKERVPAAEDEIRMLDSQNMSHLSCSLHAQKLRIFSIIGLLPLKLFISDKCIWNKLGGQVLSLTTVWNCTKHKENLQELVFQGCTGVWGSPPWRTAMRPRRWPTGSLGSLLRKYNIVSLVSSI